MSSKLVKGKGAEAQAMNWRSVGTPVPKSTDVFPPPAAQNSPPKEAPDADYRRKIEHLEKRVHSLERELEQSTRAAREQGVQQGEERVREQLSATTDAAVQRLARTIEEVTGARQRHRHEAEADVVKLALAIARRILHREVSIDPGALFGLVKAALEQMDAQEIHRVRVHPDHAASLDRHLEQIGLPRRIEVVADPSLDRGAVLLESSRGTVDASAGTQLEEIER